MTLPPVFVAVPAEELSYTRCIGSVFCMLLGLPNGSRIEVNDTSMGLCAKRNALIRTFLCTTSLEWLLFVDSDMLVSAAAASELLLQAQQRALDVAAPAMHVRHGIRNPVRGETVFLPVASTIEDDRIHYQSGDVTRTAGNHLMVGFGFTLIRRTLLERMDAPWVRSSPDSTEPELGPTERGEDTVFCHRAHELGARIGLVGSARVEHLARVFVPRDLPAVAPAELSMTVAAAEGLGRIRYPVPPRG